MTILFSVLAVLGIVCLITVIVLNVIELRSKIAAKRILNDIHATAGSYSKVRDIDSMHPSSCFSESPFSYKYSSNFSDSYLNRTTIPEKIDALSNRISRLENQMEEFHQFYYIDDEDDESLADMVKHLRERIDRIELKLNPIITFQEELSTFKWNMDYYAWNKRLEDLEMKVQDIYHDCGDKVFKNNEEIPEPDYDPKDVAFRLKGEKEGAIAS